MKNIFIINYQPKKKSNKAECLDAYIEEARKGGHDIRMINLHALDIGFLSFDEDDQQISTLSDELKQAQDNILWANQIVLIYPIWWLGIPAKVKAFLEKVLQQDVLVNYGKVGPEPLFKDKTVVVMQSYSMPYFVMKYIYGDLPFKTLKVILQKWCGFKIEKRFDFDLIDSPREVIRRSWKNNIKKFVKTIK